MIYSLKGNPKATSEGFTAPKMNKLAWDPDIKDSTPMWEENKGEMLHEYTGAALGWVKTQPAPSNNEAISKRKLLFIIHKS